MHDFLKIIGQKQTFFSTKYRKQTFFFTNYSNGLSLIMLIIFTIKCKKASMIYNVYRNKPQEKDEYNFLYMNFFQLISIFFYIVSFLVVKYVQKALACLYTGQKVFVF